MCIYLPPNVTTILKSSLLREVINARLIHYSTTVTSLYMCNQFARSFVVLNFLVLWTVFLVYITVKDFLVLWPVFLVYITVKDFLVLWPILLVYITVRMIS